MRKTDHLQTVHDLNQLKQHLILYPKKQVELIAAFKIKYPYTSSDEALITLLFDEKCNLSIIAKLLLHECSKEPFSDHFYEMLQNQINMMKSH